MSEGDELLRKPGQPQRPTFLELFFDLVFVFALTRVSQRLAEDFTSERRIVLPEAGQTLLLLLAIWLIWAFTAGITDLYNPQRPEIQLLVVASMFGSLVMAVALPEAFGDRAPVFASAYLAIRVSQALLLVLALRGHEAQRRAAARPLFWFALSATPWIAGAFFADGPARGVLWTIALAVDYVGASLGHPVPLLGRSPSSEWTFRGEHLAERYQQFFIIALGDQLLVIGGTFSAGFGGGRTAGFVVAFATMALLWRIYVYRAGGLFSAAIMAAPDPGRVARSGSFAHLIMVSGIVAIAVGDELVIEHAFGRQDPAWISVIVGGPALFLAGRAIFEYAVFARVSRSRVIGLLVLVAISPVMVLVPPLLVAIAAALVLAGVAVSDAARAWGRPPEPAAPLR